MPGIHENMPFPTKINLVYIKPMLFFCQNYIILPCNSTHVQKLMLRVPNCVPWPKYPIKRQVISQYCMKISHFLAKFAILAAILNFRTLAVLNVIGGQIFWQIHIIRQIWPWKQPVLFQIGKESSDTPNPNKMVSPAKQPKCRYDFVAFTWWYPYTTICLKIMIL